MSTKQINGVIYSKAREQSVEIGREEMDELSAELLKNAEIETQAADQRREAEYMARVQENN
jgi:hypothetical protein